ncbi:MAG: PorT family protein, partial [Bacteroidetes bacterium]
HFADIVGLRLNLLYSQEGGAYSARRTITERTLYTQRLQYLKIPLLLYLNSGTVDRKVIFAFAVGPQINFLSKAYAYNDNPAIDLPLPDNFSDFPSQKEIYTSFTYGIASEVGVDIQLPPDNFVLNLHLRGDYALSDAENKDASFRITDGGLTNRYNYWNYYRGISRDAETFPLNVGLQIGITYTFAQGE